MSHFDFKSFLNTLTTHPGVYQMLNDKDEVLYVGKAANLKNRVSSYFSGKTLGVKTEALVKHIARIQTTVTANETEALLLEHNLIKQLKPKYNILLRDDKSYPYIHVSIQDTYPRIETYRGKKKDKKGLYFGPYPNALSVKETLYLLQKIFKIRSCSNIFFRNRSRPCLQYQIQRCSAPCVKYISPEEYKISVDNALQFLQGKSQTLLKKLEKQMEDASLNLDFELAARYRDQLIHLRKIQERKEIVRTSNNLDVIGITFQHGLACLHLLPVRSGEVQGGQNFFPSLPDDNSNLGTILEAFIMQYYLSPEHQTNIPPAIIIPPLFSDETSLETLEAALSQLRGKKCRLFSKVRGIRAKWLQLAERNSIIALQQRLGAQSTLKQRFEALKTALSLKKAPQRLECFDISHTAGEETVASCVVFDENGPKKSDYRRFNIQGIKGGDDYAAMRQALYRRYSRSAQENTTMPDILFIDGGKGQLRQAVDVLEELNISSIQCIGIAKGPDRKPGLETLILANNISRAMTLNPDSPALHLIQHIRDESHRFALLGHRHKRDQKRTRSTLEGIDGIGAKRRQALYRRFGGLQEIKKASIEELAQTPGISPALAAKIHEMLH